MALFCILNALCCCYRYYDSYLPFLLEACNDECPDVRQVSPPFDLLHINVSYIASLYNNWVVYCLTKKKIKFIFRQRFMGLVSVPSLVDLFSNSLLEVSCSYLCLCRFVCVLHHCFIQFFCSIAEALSRLNAVITHPNAHHSDNVMAYDNAVSALGKICQFHRDSINAAQVLCILVLHVFIVVEVLFSLSLSCMWSKCVSDL